MEAEPAKAPPPKRKRRWFQFSLRTLLSITLICTVQLSVESAPLDAQKLYGVWLVQSAESNGQNCLSQAWTSKIAIEAGTFTVSRFCGSSSDLHGRFALDTSAATKALTLSVDEIDLSEIWEGVKYPKCSLLGIYMLDHNTLTVCFRTGSQPQRPSDFISKDRSTLVLSLVRAETCIATWMVR